MIIVYTILGDIMDQMKQLLTKMNDIPIDLLYEKQEEKTGILFSYLSLHHDRVYGRFFESKEKSKNAWIVLYHGLGAHTLTKGYLEFVKWWTDEGFDVIGIDMRHQGGLTKGNPEPDQRGLYLSGLSDFEHYYYTAVYLDSYRLIDVALQIKSHPMVIANGGSQGGALALFVGAMHPKTSLILADMPSNTDIKTLIHGSTGGFKAFLDHEVTPPYWLLSEIDLLNYAPKIKVPVLLTSGTLDQICPLSTAEKLFLSLDGDKTFMHYDAYGHGGYDEIHFPEKLKTIRYYQKKDR